MAAATGAEAVTGGAGADDGGLDMGCRGGRDDERWLRGVDQIDGLKNWNTLFIPEEICWIHPALHLCQPPKIPLKILRPPNSSCQVTRPVPLHIPPQINILVVIIRCPRFARHIRRHEPIQLPHPFQMLLSHTFLCLKPPHKILHVIKVPSSMRKSNGILLYLTHSPSHRLKYKHQRLILSVHHKIPNLL
ncbi:hypothetical protein IEQ34_022942 [Dendrobium chrysotoxum]|uniref:Uncharacterized protein n=1 Tax=Dendrobium chrysotoxum TaxID=161865 RepID=A0AAV7FZ45_DENCH|nr:hypothetical protein IEQ34_022942 [Dendrobium chrysotoxum]